MGILTDAFDRQIQAGLRARLAEAESVAEAGLALRESLAPLFQPGGGVFAALTIGQADDYRALLASTSRAAELLRTCMSTHDVAKPTDGLVDSAPRALAIAGISAAISQITNWGILGPLIGTAAGVSAHFLLLRIKPKPTQKIQVSTINPDAIISSTREMLAAVDQAAARTILSPPPAASIDSFKDVIQVLHDALSEASEEPKDERLVRQAERIEKLLLRHGIEVRSFSDSLPWSDPDVSIWDVDHASGITKPLTLTPALVKGSCVLRRGQVVLPEK